jgi:hypothetical protein
MSSIHDYTGAYALDALDALEQTRFETHLPSCDACRDEIRTLTSAAFRLSEGLSEEPPPWIRAEALAVPGPAAVVDQDFHIPAPRRWRLLRRS